METINKIIEKFPWLTWKRYRAKNNYAKIHTEDRFDRKIVYNVSFGLKKIKKNEENDKKKKNTPRKR